MSMLHSMTTQNITVDYENSFSGWTLEALSATDSLSLCLRTLKMFSILSSPCSFDSANTCPSLAVMLYSLTFSDNIYPLTTSTLSMACFHFSPNRSDCDNPTGMQLCTLFSTFRAEHSVAELLRPLQLPRNRSRSSTTGNTAEQSAHTWRPY
jgi:hypothetical protein